MHHWKWTAIVCVYLGRLVVGLQMERVDADDERVEGWDAWWKVFDSRIPDYCDGILTPMVSTFEVVSTVLSTFQGRNRCYCLFYAQNVRDCDPSNFQNSMYCLDYPSGHAEEEVVVVVGLSMSPDY